MKSLECILNLKTRIWSQKKTLFKDIRFVYKPWKYNDRLWQTRSWMTKENVIKSMFFVYKNTTSSKVCMVQKYVNKSVFSQFKPCLFFRTSTLHFWLSSVCFDAFKTSDIFHNIFWYNKTNLFASSKLVILTNFAHNVWNHLNSSSYFLVFYFSCYHIAVNNIITQNSWSFYADICNWCIYLLYFNLSLHVSLQDRKLGCWFPTNDTA